jgi:hypothetical protein
MDPEFADIQGELEAIQKEHRTEATDIGGQKQIWRVVFSFLYVIGTLCLIAGAVIKAYAEKNEKEKVPNEPPPPTGPAGSVSGHSQVT